MKENTNAVGGKNLPKIIITAIVLAVFILGFFIAKESFNFGKIIESKNEAAQTSQLSSNPDQEKYRWEITEIATGLNVPWDIQLDKSGRIFITERGGIVKILETGGKITEIGNFSQVATIGEEGMTGLALSPNFSENNYIYIYYTFRKGALTFNRVSRFIFNGKKIQDEKILIDNIPGASTHNGGRMKFGPDNKLWITTGDAANGNLAQNQKSLAGKILRVNEDGGVPDDNPTAGSLVYSIGHRNPQGIDFHPVTGEIVVTSHGASAFDEINIVTPGSNHGWPDTPKCFSDNPKFVNPILCSMEETWAPSGGAFLGTTIWQFRDSYIFAGLKGEMLEKIDIVGGKAINQESIIKGTYGRLRAVTADKLGNLYVTTSNRDGRGKIKKGDDKILKISPVKI